MYQGRRRSHGEWAWDDVPVRPMRFMDAMTWWSTADTESVRKDVGSFFDFAIRLQDEEIGMIHRRSQLVHEMRVEARRKFYKTVDNGCSLMTPLFHGRGKPSAFLIEKYVETLNADDKVNRRRWQKAHR